MKGTGFPGRKRGSDLNRTAFRIMEEATRERPGETENEREADGATPPAPVRHRYRDGTGQNGRRTG